MELEDLAQMIEKLNWFALLTKSNFEQTVFNIIVKKKNRSISTQNKKEKQAERQKSHDRSSAFPRVYFCAVNL